MLKNPTNAMRKRGRPRATTPKSEALRVRLITDEKEAFEALAASLEVSPSKLLRRMIHEAVGAGPALFDDGVVALVDAGNAVSAVGRNINQITRAINSGKTTIGNKEQDEIVQLAAVLVALKKELRRLISKSKTRRIRLARGKADG